MAADDGRLLSFVWSRLSTAVELSTRYTTADIVLEIGSTSAVIKQVSFEQSLSLQTVVRRSFIPRSLNRRTGQQRFAASL